MEDRTQVVIAGAGPVGLLVALRLGRAGIKTTVLERHVDILPTTRAIVYNPVVIPALRELGVLDLVIRNAYLNHDGVHWLDLSGKMLARLPVGTGKPSPDAKPEDDFDGILLLGQQRLAKLLLEEIKKSPSVTVRWDTSIFSFTQDDSLIVTILAKDRQSNTDVTIKSDWLLGTDGANSTVRNAAGISFDGFTWPDFKIVGADVWYDFGKAHGLKPMNFIVHPEKWAVVIYCGQDDADDPYGSGTPLWRVAYAVPPDTSEDTEHIRQLSMQRIAEYAPGEKAENIRISRAEPYKMQQRCAGQARKGRVLLAGDALHSNNPIGGLGLTTGIVDAAAYANALVRVLKDGESETLLTKCAENRRQAWLDVTNPASIMNVKRLYATSNEDIKERDAYFENLNTDPEFVKEQFGKLGAIGRDMVLPYEQA